MLLHRGELLHRPRKSRRAWLSLPIRAGALTVLQFHGVGAGAPGDAAHLEQRCFERMLDALERFTTVLPLEDAYRRLEQGNLPNSCVCLTFDDGYANWVDVVAPELLRRGLQATFFVSTGHLDGKPLWHERIEHALQRLPADVSCLLPVLPARLAGLVHMLETGHRQTAVGVIQEVCKYLPLTEREVVIRTLESMGTGKNVAFRPFDHEDVRRLHRMGFAIGAHTVDHPILSMESDSVAMSELGRAREVLEGVIQARVNLLAYPNGRPLRDYDERHIEMAQRCGYTLAVSTAGGVAQRGGDRMQVPRYAPWRPQAALLGWDLVRNSWRHPLSTAQLRTRPRHRVMLVENGAGFGGAVVAATTLLRQTDSAQVEVHLVSNTPFEQLQGASAVKSIHRLNGRWLNLRPLARAAQERFPAPVARLATTCLSVMDEALNRLPYLMGLLWVGMRVRPDLIHGNNGPTSNREALLAARLMRLPYIQHLRGPHASSPGSLWELAQARAVIPVSRWLAQRLIRDGIDPLRIRHIYDGMPLGDTESGGAPRNVRAELRLSSNTPLVVMAGMLVKWKGQLDFIQACQRLSSILPDVHFLVIGGEPAYADTGYRSELEIAAQGLTQAGRLTFMGQVPQVSSLMGQFDVVVSASVEPEPLGLIMLEALACGCEFVGPNHGGAQEVVSALGRGHLFTPCDASSMADVIRMALSTRADREATEPTVLAEDRARMRQQIETLFSEAACAEATLQAYESARPGGW